MKIYAINGSPKKNCSTDTFLEKYLKGAASISPESKTEKIHLHDYQNTGCRECMI